MPKTRAIGVAGAAPLPTKGPAVGLDVSLINKVLKRVSDAINTGVGASQRLLPEVGSQFVARLEDVKINTFTKDNLPHVTLSPTFKVMTGDQTGMVYNPFPGSTAFKDAGEGLGRLLGQLFGFEPVPGAPNITVEALTGAQALVGALYNCEVTAGKTGGSFHNVRERIPPQAAATPSKSGTGPKKAGAKKVAPVVVEEEPAEVELEIGDAVSFETEDGPQSGILTGIDDDGNAEVDCDGQVYVVDPENLTPETAE